MKKIPFVFFMFFWASTAFGLPLEIAGQVLEQDDMIYLLSRQMNVSTEVAALAWSDMDQTRKAEFIAHATDVLMLAEAGSLRGLAFNQDVRRQLKWDRINTLAKAYVDRVKMDWVIDENTVETFYKKNLSRYSAPERIFAKLGKLSFDGEPRWYQMTELPTEVRSALEEKISLGKFPPVVASDGQIWQLEVLNLGTSRVLPLSAVRERVLRDIRSSFLDKDISRLRERFSVQGVDTK